MLKIILASLFSLSAVAAPTPVNLTIQGQAYDLLFSGGEFCGYETIEVKKDGKVLKTFGNLCGQQISPAAGRFLDGKVWAMTVKLGPDAKDEYVYLAQFFQGKAPFAEFLSFDKGQPKIAFKAPVDGALVDYDQDGYLDLIKDGGKGEQRQGAHSYDPYLIYRNQKKKTGLAFALDTALSKKYSAEKGYAWQGAQPSLSILVNEKGVTLLSLIEAKLAAKDYPRGKGPSEYIEDKEPNLSTLTGAASEQKSKAYIPVMRKIAANKEIFWEERQNAIFYLSYFSKLPDVSKLLKKYANDKKEIPEIREAAGK